MTTGDIQILRVTQARQVEALKILFSRFPIDQQAARVEDTLLAERGGVSVGGALVMHQPDDVALVWPPVIQDRADERRIGGALMTAVCRDLDDSRARFAQCLLSPEEADEAGWLLEFGFSSAAKLYFLARSLEEIPAVEPGLDEFETFVEPGNVERFAALIEQTYEGSLDCPMLNGRRSGADALASHRLSGQFDPRGWRLYQSGGRDVAVLLLNEHPDQDAVELVYFGVAPDYRGRGFGRRVLGEALALARSWKRAAMFLAVDAGNAFANQIYSAWGFQEVAQRNVWLRFPGNSAQQ